MYINIDFKLTEQIEQQIKEETVKTCCEQLMNSKELADIIKQCVKGIIKVNINELIQGKSFREFLTEKIKREIGME